MTRDWLPELADENPWYVVIRTKFHELLADGLTTTDALAAATEYGLSELEEAQADIAEGFKL